MYVNFPDDGIEFELKNDSTDIRLRATCPEKKM